MDHALSSSVLDAVRIPNISSGAASDERKGGEGGVQRKRKAKNKGVGGAPRALRRGGRAWDSPEERLVPSVSARTIESPGGVLKSSDAPLRN